MNQRETSWVDRIRQRTNKGTRWWQRWCKVNQEGTSARPKKPIQDQFIDYSYFSLVPNTNIQHYARSLAVTEEYPENFNPGTYRFDNPSSGDLHYTVCDQNKEQLNYCPQELCLFFHQLYRSIHGIQTTTILDWPVILQWPPANWKPFYLELYITEPACLGDGSH